MNKPFIVINVTKNRYKKLFIDDILYFKADRSYCLIKTLEEEFILTRPLKEVSSDLSSDVFIKINRSYIINIYNCIELKIGFNPELVLCNKEVIKPCEGVLDELVLYFNLKTKI